MVERKFDIFAIIKEIEGIQIEFFDNLQDYEIKQISPYMLMKWMSGVKDPTQLIQLNDTVNTVIFSMYKHPKLMYKTLMASATRKDKRVSWIKRPSKDKIATSLSLVAQYYDCSTSRANDYLKILTPEEIFEIGESLGIDKETSTKLKKELNGK